MRKVVIVVGDGKTVTFEGEQLQVDNNSSSYLIVRDMGKPAQERDLAVFRSWRYWRVIHDVGSGKKETEITYGETDKVIIRNREGFCVAVLYILPDGNLADDSWIRHKAAIEKLKIEPITEDEDIGDKIAK